MAFKISDIDSDFLEILDPNELSDQELEYINSISENEDF